MTRGAIFTHYRERRLEWCLAGYLVYLGYALTLPPNSMSASSFVVALRNMTEDEWGIAFLTGGALYVLALHINGRAAWTPFFRAAMTFVGSQLFLHLALSLMKVQYFGLSVLTYLYISFVFFGAAFVSAAFDCGREIKIWRARHGWL